MVSHAQEHNSHAKQQHHTGSFNRLDTVCRKVTVNKRVKLSKKQLHHQQDLILQKAIRSINSTDRPIKVARTLSHAISIDNKSIISKTFLQSLTTIVTSIRTQVQPNNCSTYFMNIITEGVSKKMQISKLFLCLSTFELVNAKPSFSIPQDIIQDGLNSCIKSLLIPDIANEPATRDPTTHNSQCGGNTENPIPYNPTFHDSSCNGIAISWLSTYMKHGIYVEHLLISPTLREEDMT